MKFNLLAYAELAKPSGGISLQSGTTAVYQEMKH